MSGDGFQICANFPRSEIQNATVLLSRGQMAESHLEFTKPAHVVGRYALYGRLAAGGMATVHLGRMAEVDGTSRTVAVKRLHPQFCKDPEFVAMFIDEARLAARIKHANVVETLDILTMGQELLLVMEYIRGECFSKLLRAARRKNLEPSIGVVGHIASGMLHGLHAAHEVRDDRGEPLHVVHRDISPQNVMIDVDGAVKVLDFGVAKASARIQITRDGQMKGKLSYMSPEQLQGMPVDRRADVFACGVVLWEALTRRRLFVGEDASEVLRKILRDEVPRPSEFVPELTSDMDEVVLRALCKDPERRYQTAEELAIDIENVIGLANPNDVTAWIYSVAGEILTKRERLLQEIERLGSEGLPLPSTDPSAGGSVHGSIADSDTFQRIQSWAEREAARAADLSSRPSLELDEGSSDAVETVADARLESSSFPPPVPAALAPTVPAPALREPFDSAPGVPLDDAELGLEEIDDEPTSKSVPLPAGVASAAPEAAVFSHAPRPKSEAARRRQRRLVTLLSAAGVFGLLTLVAVIAVQPVALMRASGALRPETSAAPASRAAATATTASAASALPAGVPAPPTESAGSTRALKGGDNAGEGEPALARAVLPPDPVSHPVSHPVGSPGVVVSPALGSPTAAAHPASASGSTADASFDEGAASRVSLALAASKLQAAPKRATKHQPVARRARSAAAAPAPRAISSAPPATAAAAANKLDCKQPFWIDEKGIRRLKMACL
jgi:eukaryotic-like serine/threonine-protein kinase